MDEKTTERYGQELYRAFREHRMVRPLTEREPGITVDDAYGIQERMIAGMLGDGETIIGKKIGVTSEVVQKALDVNRPDFGQLTSQMVRTDGDTIHMSDLIQPRAEGEIAFVLGEDLEGPGIEPEDVLPATERLVACFEIVDSRIENWKIRIQDTIADDASSALFVLGKDSVRPGAVDLERSAMVLEKNGEVVGRGTGAATLGSPLIAVAWLANTLGRFGIVLRRGETILSGSLGPLVPAAAGDRMRVTIEAIGSATVRFAQR